MTDRERLIEILKKPIYVKEGVDVAIAVADYLLDNGVTISKPKTIRPPADLKGKCGSCIYSKPYDGESRTFKSYIECTNEEHCKKYCYRKNSKYRQRTAKACKSYEERVEKNGL